MPDDRPSLTCPRCSATTHHPTDVAERYCPRCHQFHVLMVLEDLIARVRRAQDAVDRLGRRSATEKG